MALLKAHTVAKLAILLNCCMGFIYSRPAVQWHLYLKRSPRMSWVSFAHGMGTGMFVPPSPSCPSPAALRSSLLRLLYSVIELLDSTPFLIPSMCFTPVN